MRTGSRVRRRAWASGMKCFVDPDTPFTSNIWAWDGQVFAFVTSDLIADDWEIAI